MVIISWIIGALLPIIALFMTSMVANNIQLIKTSEIEKNEVRVVADVKEEPKQDNQDKKNNNQTKVIIQPKEKEIIREIIKEPAKKNDSKSSLVNMSADTLA
jgi:hypothetical protein